MAAFDALLPAQAVAVEADSAALWESGLWPAEAALVANAVEKRRREFTAGRNCARLALAALGREPVAIGIGAQRQPLFPEGVCGSITHTADYCAAAAVSRRGILGIGIDAEVAEPLQPGLASLVLLPEEQAIASALVHRVPCCDMVLFSIKEAFFKAWFQVVPRYLDFLEASVELWPEQQRFSIGVLRQDAGDYFRGRRFTGRYTSDAHRVYSAIALAAQPESVSEECAHDGQSSRYVSRHAEPG